MYGWMDVVILVITKLYMYTQWNLFSNQHYNYFVLSPSALLNIGIDWIANALILY